MAGFKVGDVVTLKSGGPDMTVSQIDDKGRSIVVTWFDNKNKPQHASYPPEVLKLNDPEAGGFKLDESALGGEDKLEG